MAMRKMIFVAAAVLALAALDPVAAAGKNGGKYRPYKGWGFGTTYTTAVTPTEFSGYSIGREYKKPIGVITYRTDPQYTEVIGPDTLQQSAPKSVIKAKNGDKLFSAQEGTGNFTPPCLLGGPGCVVTSSFDSKINGGTGRFKNARGNADITVRAVRTEREGTTSTYSTCQRFKGRISY